MKQSSWGIAVFALLLALTGCVGEPAAGRCIDNADCPRNSFCAASGECVVAGDDASADSAAPSDASTDTATASEVSDASPQDTAPRDADADTGQDTTGDTGVDAADTTPHDGDTTQTCACEANETCCDGVCQDLQTAHEACGACGQACPASETCVDGVCTRWVYEWPRSPTDYPASATDVAYMTSLTLPTEDDEGTPTCCHDFGTRSRDHVEDGTHELDNGLVKLAATLSGLGLDMQAAYDGLLSSGELVILLDHRGLETPTDPDGFALAVLDGAWGANTDAAAALSGEGTFDISMRNFSFNQGGTPTQRFEPALLADGHMSAGPAGLSLAIPFGVLVVDVPLSEVRLAGDLTATDGLRYANGELSGYLRLADLVDAFNDVLSSAQCSCLGQDTDVYSYTEDGGMSAQCLGSDEVNQACPADDEEICRMLAGGSSSGSPVAPCSFVSSLLEGQADIDLDGDCATNAGACDYEAISVGLRWTAVPATVDGLRP